MVATPICCRVERVNRTLQDRLVKELRLAGIADMAAGNDFLPGFMARFNERFATPAADRQDMHRPLNMPPDRLADVLCWREQRYVGQQLAFSYQRKRIILDETDLTRGLAGKYVDTYAFADGGLDVRWKGPVLVLSRLRQRPTRDSRGDRGKQAAQRSPCLREGFAGSSQAAQSEDQQREEWIPENRA